MTKETNIVNRANIEIQTYLTSALAMFDKVDGFCYESDRLKQARRLIEEEICKLEDTIQNYL